MGTFRTLDKEEIVWKKAWCRSKNKKTRCIIKLLLPPLTKVHEEESREALVGRKCRASRSLVLSILAFNYDTQKYEIPVSTASAKHDHTFRYKLGEMVSPKEPFSKEAHSCRSGIHYFKRRKDAESY